MKRLEVVRRWNLSQTCCTYTGGNAICTVWWLPVSTGYFERLWLLRVPRMKWSTSPFCPLLFGGGDSKQSPIVLSKLSCSPFSILFNSASSSKKIVFSVWRGNLHVLPNITVDDINSGFIRFCLLIFKGKLLQGKKKKIPISPARIHHTFPLALSLPSHCPSLFLTCAVHPAASGLVMGLPPRVVTRMKWNDICKVPEK